MTWRRRIRGTSKQLGKPFKVGSARSSWESEGTYKTYVDDKWFDATDDKTQAIENYEFFKRVYPTRKVELFLDKPVRGYVKIKSSVGKMGEKTTPTEKYLDQLWQKGYKVEISGGEGFILPRYWKIRRPDGTYFWATKTKHLKEELGKAELRKEVGAYLEKGKVDRKGG